MKPNPKIMQAVEQLQYRVTIADVAAQSGMDIQVAQQGLLALATDAKAHLQIVESGDIIYQFPKNFRAILRNKFWQLQLAEQAKKLWQAVFYLIRISFGIVLVASILLVVLTIAIIVIGWSLRGGDSEDDRRRDDQFQWPAVWMMPDFSWIFVPDYDLSQRQHRQADTRSRQESPFNFLEGIFSFLFGDGNPNAFLEDRRWQAIAAVIRQHQGAVIAEQIAPYLDTLDSQNPERDQGLEEAYMMGVLSRFNGRPEVSPEGQLIYHFPELQTTVSRTSDRPLTPYLEEQPWLFSQASFGQKMAAIALGSINLIGALVLGSLLRGGEAAAQMGGLVLFVQSIYWLLLGYGIAFLAIPLVRYVWVQWRNQQLQTRNAQRQQRANDLNQSNVVLDSKRVYARQFVTQRNLDQQAVVYTTERDLIEQEVENQQRIDEDWEKRLKRG